MTMLKSEVREDLRSGPCESCGEHIPEDDDLFLTFYRGSFIILHNECAGNFIETGQKSKRPERS